MGDEGEFDEDNFRSWNGSFGPTVRKRGLQLILNLVEGTPRYQGWKPAVHLEGTVEQTMDFSLRMLPAPERG